MVIAKGNRREQIRSKCDDSGLGCMGIYEVTCLLITLQLSKTKDSDLLNLQWAKQEVTHS